MKALKGNEELIPIFSFSSGYKFVLPSQDHVTWQH